MKHLTHLLQLHISKKEQDDDSLQIVGMGLQKLTLKNKTNVAKEERASGAISSNVYADYIRANNSWPSKRDDRPEDKVQFDVSGYRSSTSPGGLSAWR